MKDQWYADNRDLVKWSGLVRLCGETGIKHVLQVAYYRESTIPLLNFNGQEKEMPKEVFEHFRDIEDIKRLGKKAGLIIDVVNDDFTQANRKDYNTAICDIIHKQTQPQVVFLDPDNGIIEHNAKPEHVEVEEVSTIWQSLKTGDCLVLYQHRFRNTNWKSLRREQFAKSCRVKPSKIQMWEPFEKHKDVVFFFCEK